MSLCYSIQQNAQKKPIWQQSRLPQSTKGSFLKVEHDGNRHLQSSEFTLESFI